MTIMGDGKMERKKFFRYVLSVVMMFTLLFQGIMWRVSAAGPARQVPSTVTSFEIQNSSGQTVNSVWYKERFLMKLDWDASGTQLQAGDYFDIDLPQTMKFPSDTTTYDFNVMSDDGTAVIATAHITPGPGDIGGKVRLTFTNWVTGRTDVRGNIKIASKFLYTSLLVNQNNTFSVSVNGQVVNKIIRLDGPTPLDNDEVLKKSGEGVPGTTDQALWKVRINYKKATLTNVVITDHLTGGNGTETYIPGSFELYSVDYSTLGEASNPVAVSLAGKITFGADNRSFTINLGTINATQYRLIYKTTYTPDTRLTNHVDLTSTEQNGGDSGYYQTLSSSGTATGNLANKIKLIKVDAEDNATRLANAVFTVTKPDGTTFELTTGADGTVTSAALPVGTYKVKERVAPQGYELNEDEYTLQVTATDGAIQTIKDNPIKIDVATKKKWIGPEGTSVTIHLYADNVNTGKTVVLNAANNWSDTFVDLRKYQPGTTTEINYTVLEDAVLNYDSVVTGSMVTGYTITNTNTETRSVDVEKKWVGQPATSITVKLLADGSIKDTITITSADNWRHTFANLPKYDANDGHEIIYTIDEDRIAGYTTSITGDAQTGFTITNFKETPKTADYFNPMMYTTLMVISLSIMIMVVAKKKTATR